MNSLVTYEKPVVSLSNLFDEFFDEPYFSLANREISNNLWPKVDIVENDNDYTIHADLPGVEKKNIKINVEKGILSISGEKGNEKKEKKKGRYSYLEREYGSFNRTFALPENVDEKKINATFKNGILELTLQKKEEVKPKTIEVKVE